MHLNLFTKTKNPYLLDLINIQTHPWWLLNWNDLPYIFLNNGPSKIYHFIAFYLIMKLSLRMNLIEVYHFNVNPILHKNVWSFWDFFSSAKPIFQANITTTLALHKWFIFRNIYLWDRYIIRETCLCLICNKMITCLHIFYVVLSCLSTVSWPVKDRAFIVDVRVFVQFYWRSYLKGK